VSSAENGPTVPHGWFRIRSRKCAAKLKFEREGSLRTANQALIDFMTEAIEHATINVCKPCAPHAARSANLEFRDTRVGPLLGRTVVMSVVYTPIYLLDARHCFYTESLVSAHRSADFGELGETCDQDGVKTTTIRCSTLDRRFFNKDKYRDGYRITRRSLRRT
jgi:hypothetical protein